MTDLTIKNSDFHIKSALNAIFNKKKGLDTKVLLM